MPSQINPPRRLRRLIIHLPRLGALLGVLALGLSVGCASFRYATPAGFVELKDHDDYDYRAVNAEGVVLAARAIPHDPKGDLDFWTRSIDKEVRLLGGYALLDQREVSTDTGLKGRQLRFGHDEGRTPYLYQVTLLLTDKKILLLEAGGSKAEMDKIAPQIDQALHKFALR